MENFKIKFRISELTIRNYDFWNVSIRPQQITLGSLILSLKRNCASFGFLTKEETAELAIIFSEIEQLYASTFKPEKLNYIALMMIDEHIHFHIIPRYQFAVNFNGLSYKDKDWPNPPDFSENLHFSTEQLFSLKGIFE